MSAVKSDVLTAEAMVKRARNQVDAFNTDTWEQMRAGLAPDFRYQEFGTARKADGPEKTIELFKGWKQAFPDATATITNEVASGDTATLEVTWKGTHNGPLVTAEGTIPASGKRQETPAAMVFTFTGDKITECHHYFDSLTLLKQIGA